MTKEAIQQATDRQPFRPFTLFLADGRTVEVLHRDDITLHPRGRTVFVFGQNDEFSIVDMGLVTEIRSTGAAA